MIKKLAILNIFFNIFLCKVFFKKSGKAVDAPEVVMVGRNKVLSFMLMNCCNAGKTFLQSKFSDNKSNKRMYKHKCYKMSCGTIYLQGHPRGLKSTWGRDYVTIETQCRLQTCNMTAEIGFDWYDTGYCFQLETKYFFLQNVDNFHIYSFTVDNFLHCNRICTWISELFCI